MLDSIWAVTSALVLGVVGLLYFRFRVREQDLSKAQSRSGSLRVPERRISFNKIDAMSDMPQLHDAFRIYIHSAWRWSRTFQNLNIPAPKPVPLIGNLSILFKEKSFVYMTDTMTKQYGKVFGFFFGLSPTLFVTNLDTVRDILSKHFHAFVNRSGVAALEHRPWDSTLLFLTDDHWRHVRTQLSPTFSTGKLKQVVSTIDHVTKNLENNVQELAAKGETVELKKLCGSFSMDVIAGAAFGVQVDSLVNPDDVFNQRALDLINENQWVVLCVSFPVVLKFLKLIGITVPPASATQYFVSFLKAALQERRQDNTQNKNKDFLQLMVEAEKEGTKGPVDKDIDFSRQVNTSSQWKQKGLTEDEILGNALSFMFGGYDTVSTVMSYTLFSLAGNPECLRKAQEEVDSVLGENGQMTYEKANELTYLDMCLSEAMRMYPPFFLLGRKCTEDVEVAGGYHVTKGMDIMIPVVNIHMDPDYWPEPEKFDPQRFTPEERAKRHPFAYLPFGQGPRNCIGMRLAQLEIRMAIASLLRRYSPVLCDKSVYPPRLLILSRVDAIDGLWVKFQLRD